MPVAPIQPEFKVHIDYDKCRACHRCVTHCPAHCITIKQNDLALRDNANWSPGLPTRRSSITSCSMRARSPNRRSTRSASAAVRALGQSTESVYCNYYYNPHTAQFYSPAEIIVIDVDPNRLEVALRFGATKIVDNRDGAAITKVMELTSGHGVDVAIEATGLSVTFDVCQEIVTAGGRIANIGVHGKPVELKLEKLWMHNITLTTGLVDTRTTPQLLKTVQSGTLNAGQLVTHHFRLDEMMEAYDVFGNAAAEKALKVSISA